MDLNSNFQLKRYSGSGSQDPKITQLWIPVQKFDHVRIVTTSGPKVRAQNRRDCGKWTENLVRIWIMSRSLQFPDPNLELKMDVSVVNGPKAGHNSDHVTIVPISGPKSRAQDGRVCGKWTENLVRIWIMSRSWQFPDPNLELKMDVSVVNGPKTWSEFGSCHDRDNFRTKNLELKMAVSVVNGLKTWSEFGSCHERYTSFRTKSSSSKWRYLP